MAHLQLYRDSEETSDASWDNILPYVETTVVRRNIAEINKGEKSLLKGLVQTANLVLRGEKGH